MLDKSDRSEHFAKICMMKVIMQKKVISIANGKKFYEKSIKN